MFTKTITLLAAIAIAPLVIAQEQVPIYVPFEWSKVPATATVIGSAGATTTFALIDEGSTFQTPGPAILIQGPDSASMRYVNEAASPAQTLSGVCNLVSPVAVCTLNVQETGAPLPPNGNGGGAGTGTGSTTKKGGSSSTPTGRTGSGGSTGPSSGSSTGAVISMTTVALGFCVGLAFLR
ncbi:hypothetical protein D9619_006605 [Psilocybe cf. subviscida]|uniref:Uncharacterized protein n=1 Tax=Psilocybe cf. subviscida TaxID=2480587 RepID=A0A8H5EXQ1_9AGAR|nr:hypothetical protein D9619_006605 [Psilocybe cf. subviscida]